MIALDQTRTKRLVAVHGWSGTVLGLLLYAVVLTGAIAVFANEIGTWSKGGENRASAVEGRLHKPLYDLARSVDPSFHEEIMIRPAGDHRLRFSFQRHELNDETGQIEDYAKVFYVDGATGETLSTETGFLRDLGGRNPGDALERFLVDLHVRLYVPQPWGLFLTGVLGLAMMVAAVSGFMMHRHLLRDLFTAPRERGLLSDRRDRHVLAAAWGLPFSILLAFTGAFFSFAISLGLPIVAMVAFGGDQEAIIERVLAVPQSENPVAAPLASLDYIVMDSTKRTGKAPVLITIENYGRDDARVTTNHGYAQGALLPISLMFDGHTRAFLGEKPTLGTTPSTGSAAVSLMGPLHFGNFSGLASKTAWFALGLAMSFVVATGMQLWVKRRAEDPRWRQFGTIVEITVWGLPLALLGSAVAFFIMLPTGNTLWWTPFGFLLAAGAAIWIGLRTENVSGTFQPIIAALCIGLPVLRHLTGGTSWSEALLEGETTVLTIDILLVIAGLALLRYGTTPRRVAPEPVLEPAE
ncbi:MAG: PepSY-associated TM helix domain-containing protein [Pseudomonadota bacterium]